MGGKKNLPVGTETVNQNGYRNVKVDLGDGKTGWRLVHQVVAEEKILKRPLRSNERVIFVDPSQRQNVHPDNLKVVVVKGATATKRAAQIEARIHELVGEYKLLTGRDFELNG